MRYDTEETNINNIKSGDTILHNGNIVTVSSSDIKVDCFIGVSIFGDCYSLGYKLVKKVSNLRY